MTYIIQRSPMLRRLNNLNRRILPHNRRIINRQRYLRDADTAIIRYVVGPHDAKDGLHGQGVVVGHGADAEVDVEEGVGVALEPARLEADGAAADGPFGAVGGHGHSAACVGGGFVSLEGFWVRILGFCCCGDEGRGRWEIGGGLPLTWIDPLHAVRVSVVVSNSEASVADNVWGEVGAVETGDGAIGLEVVASPAGVGDDCVGGGEGGEEGEESGGDGK